MQKITVNLWKKWKYTLYFRVNITVLVYKMIWFWNWIYQNICEKKIHITPLAGITFNVLPWSPVGSKVDYIQELRGENTWQIRVLKWLLCLWDSNYINNFWILKRKHDVSSHKRSQFECMSTRILLYLYKLLSKRAHNASFLLPK